VGRWALWAAKKVAKKSAAKSRDASTLSGMIRKNISRAIITAAVLSAVPGAAFAQSIAPESSSSVEPRGTPTFPATPVHSISVTKPKVLESPNPEYSIEAKNKHVTGLVALSVVVGTDGRAHDIRVQRSLGYGLDQKAVEAVRKWKFEPGKVNGKPAPVQVVIDVSFHLVISYP
jgi:TonB family protein